MKITTLIASTAAALVFATGVAVADENAVLEIDGQVISTHAPAPDHMDIDEVISGWVFRTDETQALQLDDFDNPAMIFVDLAIDDYNTIDGAAGESCASCHGDVASFEGLRTVLPRWDAEADALWAMEDYINNCRTERMQAEPWRWAKQQMDSMVALISLQSRGMTMDVAIDGPAADMWESGRELYYTRVGQLDMACAHCHEDNYDVYIRADHLSQGQTNGFPAYRLKNAKLNSTHARFSGCMKNIRAQPYGVGSPEFRALELYVASRGNGLSVEGPSVRN